MKKHQAAKYRKAKKLEQSKRKADKAQKREAKRQKNLEYYRELLSRQPKPVLAEPELPVIEPEPTTFEPDLPEPAPGAMEIIAEATKPESTSPARRAFQDV